MFFQNSLAFSMIQQPLAIWSQVLMPFLNPVCTHGIPWFTYCWSVAWRIFSITLLECEMSAIATLAWTFFDIALLLDCSENWLFLFNGHCWAFQICWHVEYSTLTASSFRIWARSAGILSPPPALFVVMLPKAQLSSHSRASNFRWVTTASRLSR